MMSDLFTVFMSALRMDAWSNSTTGLGMLEKDKRLGSTFSRGAIEDPFELLDLYQGDDIAAIVCEAKPEEALRQGFELVIQDDEDEAGASKDRADAINDALRELDATRALFEAWVYGRACGGGAIFPVVDDGQAVDIALEIGRIGGPVTALHVFDRTQLTVHEWDTDVMSPTYGEPLLYRVTDVTPGGSDASSASRIAALSTGVVIHRSRLVLFGGRTTTRLRRLENGGWDDSDLGRVKDLIRDFQGGWSGAFNLVQDLAQGVFKIKNFLEIVRGGGEADLRKRLAITDLFRSALRSIVLDADMESFERVATPMTGLPELLDRFSVRLAAGVRMPVTVLMGLSPAGLNATGESDSRNWENRIAADQARILRPRILHLAKLVAASMGGLPDSADVVFPPLRTPTAIEQATLRKAVADTDHLYIQDGVLLPEQVSLSRFGGATYSAETHIDAETTKTILEAELEHAEEAAKKPPEPPPPMLPPGQPNAPPPDPRQPNAMSEGEEPTGGSEPDAR